MKHIFLLITMCLLTARISNQAQVQTRSEHLPCGGPHYGWDQASELKRKCMLQDSAKKIADGLYKVQRIELDRDDRPGRTTARTHLYYVDQNGREGNKTFIVFQRSHPDYQNIVRLPPGERVTFIFASRDQDPVWGGLRGYPLVAGGIPDS